MLANHLLFLSKYIPIKIRISSNLKSWESIKYGGGLPAPRSSPRISKCWQGAVVVVSCESESGQAQRAHACVLHWTAPFTTSCHVTTESAANATSLEVFISKRNREKLANLVSMVSFAYSKLHEIPFRNPLLMKRCKFLPGSGPWQWQRLGQVGMA